MVGAGGGRGRADRDPIRGGPHLPLYTPKAKIPETKGDVP